MKKIILIFSLAFLSGCGLEISFNSEPEPEPEPEVIFINGPTDVIVEVAPHNPSAPFDPFDPIITYPQMQAVPQVQESVEFNLNSECERELSDIENNLMGGNLTYEDRSYLEFRMNKLSERCL